MNNEQPEALRLAEYLELHELHVLQRQAGALCHAAAELRRLHEENERLRDAVAAEREKVAAWMRSKSYATGHGDTIEDLLKELEWQVAEREREACAKVCDARVIGDHNREDQEAKRCAEAIRARGEV